MAARQGSSEKQGSKEKEPTAERKKEADAVAAEASAKKDDAKPAAEAKKDDGKDAAESTKVEAKPAPADDAPPAAEAKATEQEDAPEVKPTSAAAEIEEAEKQAPPPAPKRPMSSAAPKSDAKPLPGLGVKRTLGINLSAAAKFTTLVAIEWREDGAWVSEAIVDLEDDELVEYLSSGDRTGVYAPFGWPVAMVEAVSSYTNDDQWQRASRRQFRHRQTEGFVHDVIQAEADQELWPQSVSCDRLALQARRMAQLREQLFTETGKRFDRAGGDHILEVYPPGATLLWRLDPLSANGNGVEIPPDASEKPGLLFIKTIEAAAPWLHWKEGKRGVCQKNEHTSDALLAALVARAAELNLTIQPENGHLDIARREGWMHLPAKDSLPALSKAV